MKTRTDHVKVETRTVTYYTLMQAAEKVGMQANRLWEMTQTGEFRPEINLGLGLVFTDNDITRLRPLAEKARKKQSMLAEGQKAYTVTQAAKELGLSPDSVRKIFESDPRCIRLGHQKPKQGKRRYVTLRIPVELIEEVRRGRRV